MAFQKLSPNPNEFLLALQGAAEPVFYLSETDMPIQVHRLADTGGLIRFSNAELLHHFFPNEPKLKVDWARMERPDCKGYSNFFRHYLDKIIQTSQEEIRIRYPEELDQVEKWRVLRDLWMDNLVRQRWFKVHLPDGNKKAVFAVGQFLDVEFDPDTNELRTLPGDWFVLETGTLET